MAATPGIALQEVVFEEGPYILQRGEDFYLVYRLAPGPDNRPSHRMMVDSEKTRDKAYYFFVGAVSFPERGNAIERSLASDGLSEFAKRGAVYWLNPDRSEIALEIKRISTNK